MLFHSLVATLGLVLAVEVLATPLRHNEASRRRGVPATHAVHERHTENMGKRWAKRDKPARTTVLPMRIGMKQSNLDAGHARLMEISTPGSPNYGKHMTAEEVIDFFAPARESVDAVIEWLVTSGITQDRISQSVNKQWIQFDAMVNEAEDLLFADFYYWDHSSGLHKDIACDQYHVPAHVQEHIDYVTPGIRMRENGALKRELTKRGATVLDVSSGPHYKNTLYNPDIGPIGNGTAFPGTNSTSCSTFIVAECIQVQYGVPNGTTAAPGNKLGIFENLNDHYSKADLDTYLATVYPDLNIPAGTYPENRLVDGAFGSQEETLAATGIDFSVGVESTLDFQASIPLIWPQETVLFQTDDTLWEAEGSRGFINTFLDAIDGSYCTYSAFNETGDCTDPACADPVYPDPFDPAPIGYQGQLQCGVYEPTNVVSISYSGIEDFLPNNYIYRQCSEYMKLGLQGTTVVTSSGDSGVGANGGCLGSPFEPEVPIIFTPGFPTGCPYVLSVGSTELNRPDPNAPPVPWEILDEISTTLFPSGGGFSNVHPVADYQRDAVEAFFAKVDLPFSSFDQVIVNGSFANLTNVDQVFNRGGRGFPDVAAVGDRQVILAGGVWQTQAGTSLSAPLWAAMLTLINEKRIAVGKSTLGFVNPALYANPEAFNDITVGNNFFCLSPDETTSWGFNATTGWDPVSGLGSPNFPVLEAILVAL